MKDISIKIHICLKIRMYCKPEFRPEIAAVSTAKLTILQKKPVLPLKNHLRYATV